MTILNKTFNLLTTGADSPSTDGIVVSHQGDIPMMINWAVLGDVGSGSPTFTIKVKYKGVWTNISGTASQQSNGHKSLFALGTAIKVTAPSLTTPGTDATAPRFSMSITPIGRGGDIDNGLVANRLSYTTVPSVTHVSAKIPGFVIMNPNLEGAIDAKVRNLVFLTTTGAGNATVRGYHRDKDGDFTITELAISGGANQTYVTSIAEVYDVNYTDGAGDTAYHVDVFRYPIF